MGAFWSIFNLLAGSASIIAFLLLFRTKKQIIAYRKYITHIGMFFAGAFIGSLNAGVYNFSLDSSSISGKDIIILSWALGIIVILFTLVIAFVKSKDESKAMIPYVIMIVLFFSITFLSRLSSSDDTDAGHLTNDEIRILSTSLVSKENYDRAIHYLTILRNRLDAKDARISSLDTEIDGLKQKQIVNSGTVHGSDFNP